MGKWSVAKFSVKDLGAAIYLFNPVKIIEGASLKIITLNLSKKIIGLRFSTWTTDLNLRSIKLNNLVFAQCVITLKRELAELSVPIIYRFDHDKELLLLILHQIWLIYNR